MLLFHCFNTFFRCFWFSWYGTELLVCLLKGPRVLRWNRLKVTARKQLHPEVMVLWRIYCWCTNNQALLFLVELTGKPQQFSILSTWKNQSKKKILGRNFEVWQIVFYCALNLCLVGCNQFVWGDKHVKVSIEVF